MGWRSAPLLLFAWLAAAQTPPQAVRVTVARVDAHADPSDTSAVLGTVQYGEVLPLIKAEHGWDHVTVFVKGARVDVYVPESATSMAPADASVSAAMRLADSRPLVAAGGTKPSVALDAGGHTSWIESVQTRAVPVVTSVDGFAPMAASPDLARAIDGGTPIPTDAAGSVLWTWLIPAASVTTLVPGQVLISAFYSDVPGASPDSLMPVLVRLAPAGAHWRAVAGARGPADAPFHDAADWTLATSMLQDAVSGQQLDGGSGIMKIRLARPLTPGEYAVVLRSTHPHSVAGSSIFSGFALAAGESIVVHIAWPFRVP